MKKETLPAIAKKDYPAEMQNFMAENINVVQLVVESNRDLYATTVVQPDATDVTELPAVQGKLP